MSDKPINIYITGGTNQILPNATSASQILTPKSTDMDETIVYSPFADINLSDSFFDTLKADYEGFSEWFNRKAAQGARAYVQQTAAGIQAFLYLKDESNQVVTDVEPNLPACKRLKVGTFKIDAHNTKLGERFVKKIMDEAIGGGYDEVYVTIFPRERQEPLIHLVEKYGFEKVGMKGEENVYVKDMKRITDNLLHNYPLINTANNRKFVLGIKPEFHTRLFPDSILNNERINKAELVRDVSHTNSIHKIYICYMRGVENLRKGDLIVIYRQTDEDGRAFYRSVLTSICQVEEVRTKASFHDYAEYYDYCRKYSVFTETEQRRLYNYSAPVKVIKMTYNAALTKRITNGCMQTELGIHPSYWGFFQLSDAQFNAILRKGEINEGLIVNQA